MLINFSSDEISFFISDIHHSTTRTLLENQGTEKDMSHIDCYVEKHTQGFRASCKDGGETSRKENEKKEVFSSAEVSSTDGGFFLISISLLFHSPYSRL